MRRLGLPDGLGLVLPVLLCLQSISAIGVGGDADGGNGSVWIVYLCCCSNGRGWMFEEGALRSASGEIFFNISGDLVSTGGGHIRFVYQPSSKPGWVFNPTSPGVSCPLLGSSLRSIGSSDVLGASGSSCPDDVMAVGHLHSRIVQHLQSMLDDVLPKMMPSNFVSSPGRWPAIGCELRSSVARNAGSWLQRLCCASTSCQDVLYVTHLSYFTGVLCCS
jgi:hypothetical protein